MKFVLKWIKILSIFWGKSQSSDLNNIILAIFTYRNFENQFKKLYNDQYLIGYFLLETNSYALFGRRSFRRINQT